MPNEIPLSNACDGPWNPGIESALPARLLPRSTLFRPENVFTSAALAAELHDLTGLPLEDLVVFRPERLILHELLIRITADIAVPYPEEAGMDALGITFRRMAATILQGYICPRLPELGELYQATRAALADVIEAALATVPPMPAASPERASARRWPQRLFGVFVRQREDRAREGAMRHEEERLAARWAALEASNDPPRVAAGQALARVVLAIRARHGRSWGDRALVEKIALGLAANAHASSVLGRAIEPMIAEACRREGYRVLVPQAHPMITNVKGASASGKSTMRPLQRRLAAGLGFAWHDFALISPDIWRKYLLDYASLGADYKYAGSLAGVELAIVDQKLDRYMAEKAAKRGIPHLLIDRFRFDSFAPDSNEAGSNLLTRFGSSIYMFFMITPPDATVERAWKRGLQVGRYKAVDDLLAHNIEAYSGMPALFFTWALHPGKSVHYEFLDNDVPLGERPRTIAFGWYGEMTVLDVRGLLAVDRYRKINVAARAPAEVYPADGRMAAARNTRFLVTCVRKIPTVNFAEQASGRVYARFRGGRMVAADASLLARALADPDTRAGLAALASSLAHPPSGKEPLPVLRPAASRTLGQWGEKAS